MLDWKFIEAKLHQLFLSSSFDATLMTEMQSDRMSMLPWRVYLIKTFQLLRHSEVSHFGTLLKWNKHLKYIRFNLDRCSHDHCSNKFFSVQYNQHDLSKCICSPSLRCTFHHSSDIDQLKKIFENAREMQKNLLLI